MSPVASTSRPDGESSEAPGDRQGRQWARSEMSTRRLLAAFATLLVERGYERTTLAEVGKRAGYSHGLVTQKFGSKANLLVALVERMSERFGHDWLFEMVGDRIGIDALQHVIREIRRDAQRSPDDLRAFYAMVFEGIKPIPEIQESMRRSSRAFRSDLLRLVTAGLEAGRVRPGTDPAALTDLVIDAIRGASYYWMLDPEGNGFVDRLEKLASLIGELFRA